MGKRRTGKRIVRTGSHKKRTTSPKLPKEAYEEDLRVMFCTKALIMAVTSDNEKGERQLISAGMRPFHGKNKKVNALGRPSWRRGRSQSTK